MFSEKIFTKHKNKIIILSAVLLALNFLIYRQIFSFAGHNRDLKIYFLDVGQGDSQLVILPGGVKVLIDGGPPNGKLLENLGKILPPTDRYIDLVVLSHPQLDHFGGFIEVLKRYRVGAFLSNGRAGTISAFSELKKTIQENKIKTVVLGLGDKIRNGESSFDVLWPTPEFANVKELNDTAVVLELKSKNSTALFTGDIGFKIEEELIKNNPSHIDILKVAHHGSKYSSGANFLAAIAPKIVAIGVGKNSYGHPTKEALQRLAQDGAKIYRTDQDGTVELVIDEKKIKVFKKSKSD